MKISFFFFLSLLVVACSQLSQKQEPILLLKEETFAANMPIEKTYMDTFLTAIGNKSVPLTLTWTTYMDSSKHTNRIIGYTIQRIGGLSDVYISDIQAHHDETSANYFRSDEVHVSGGSNETIATHFDDNPNAPSFTSLVVFGNTLTYEGIGKLHAGFSISVHSDGRVISTR